jgi:hypothetical protein
MIEIIVLIFLCGKMGRLAETKGLKKGLWQFYTVLAWVLAEILGIFLAAVVFQTDEILALAPVGYGLAIISYFVLKAGLSRKPDMPSTAFEFEQQPTGTAS